jgi:NADPH:quinone reductase-like Zn-dependent oxidoreductase
MKAIVQERFGPPDVLRLVDTDPPRPAPTTYWFACTPPR